MSDLSLHLIVNPHLPFLTLNFPLGLSLNFYFLCLINSKKFLYLLRSFYGAVKEKLKESERYSGQQNANWSTQNCVIPSVHMRRYHIQINRNDHQAVGNEL